MTLKANPTGGMPHPDQVATTARFRVKLMLWWWVLDIPGCTPHYKPRETVWGLWCLMQKRWVLGAVVAMAGKFLPASKAATHLWQSSMGMMARLGYCVKASTRSTFCMSSFGMKR
jgi:hypothetical protein